MPEPRGTSEETQQQTQGMTLRGSWSIKCTLPYSSCWDKGNLWGLCPVSQWFSLVTHFLDEKDPMQQVTWNSCATIMKCSAINRHLMSSPNSFKRDNFTSKTIKYSLRLGVGYVRLHPSSVLRIRAEQRWYIRLDYATCQGSQRETVGISQVHWPDSQSMPSLFCWDMIWLPRLNTGPTSLYFLSNRSMKPSCQVGNGMWPSVGTA